MVPGRWDLRALFSLFLLWALLASQPVYLGPGHVHHSGGHCCDLCHNRNTPPAPALPVFVVPQPVAAEWFEPLPGAPLPGEPLIISKSSRSPPDSFCFHVRSSRARA
jgi:hypothetical protein